jgi:hypothetical protein
LRPLKTVAAVKGWHTPSPSPSPMSLFISIAAWVCRIDMKLMVNALAAALPALASVFAFIASLMLIFGVIFLTFYEGRLRYRCADVINGTIAEVDHHTLEHGPFCSTSHSSGHHCLSNQICYDTGHNPGYGSISFDNILWTWVNVIIALSAEGFAHPMYYLSEALSSWNQVLFIILICVGHLLAIHLIVAVLFIRFEQTRAIEVGSCYTHLP